MWWRSLGFVFTSQPYFIVLHTWTCLSSFQCRYYLLFEEKQCIRIKYNFSPSFLTTAVPWNRARFNGNCLHLGDSSLRACGHDRRANGQEEGEFGSCCRTKGRMDLSRLQCKLSLLQTGSSFFTVHKIT